MDTITRTFPLVLKNDSPTTIMELCHFRDMSFDDDERIGIYLEAWMCNLSLKSFNLGVIPDFDGSESEAEKMAKFTAAENKSQKLGLKILSRKNNSGDWQEKAEIILINRGRKDYFDLMQPYLAKNAVRILEKNDSLGVQLIDYGNGLLKNNDSIGIELGVTVTIAKKNNMDIFNARLAALELALENRLINVPANTLLGRDTTTGTIQTILQSRFATPAMIDQAIIDLVGGAPGALNTLIELASALNNDANFAATVTNNLATKVDKTTNEIIGGDKTFSGFTALGQGNTGIKKKVLENIATASSQGGFVQIAHGITSRIASVSVMVNWSGNAWVPPNYTFNSGRQFSWDMPDANTISVINISGNSGFILSKNMKIVIEYTN